MLSPFTNHEVFAKHRHRSLDSELNNTTCRLLELFDALGFHPSVVEVSRSRFAAGQLADSIFAAFRCVERRVKAISGLTHETGQDLMSKAFNLSSPKIQLNRLDDTSKRDEQEGFRFIFMGSMRGIRNPKAHLEILQNDPYKTLEYLGLASLLLKRLDERVKSDRES